MYSKSQVARLDSELVGYVFFLDIFYRKSRETGA